MIETLSQLKDVKHIALKKDFGETLAVDNDDYVSWTRPTR
jgi:hypothetical protein